MATRLYLRDSASPRNGSALGANLYKYAGIEPGDSAVVSDALATVAGPTGGLLFRNGGLVTYWISQPFAKDIVLGANGTVANLWMDESNAAANASAYFAFDVLAADNSYAGFWFQVVNGAELPVAGRAAQNWSFDPPARTLTKGQSLIFSIWIKDATALTMAAGHTCSFSFNGPSGADGDSWFEFPEDISFLPLLLPDYSRFPRCPLRRDAA